MQLRNKEAAICRALNDQAGLSVSLGAQAVIMMTSGDMDGAMRLHKEQANICLRLDDPVELSRSLNGQARILQNTGDPVKALELYKEVGAICRRFNDPEGVAISLFNQACVLAFNQSQPVEALPLAEEAMRIANEHGLMNLAQDFEPTRLRVHLMCAKIGVDRSTQGFGWGCLIGCLGILVLIGDAVLLLWYLLG